MRMNRIILFFISLIGDRVKRILFSLILIMIFFITNTSYSYNISSYIVYDINSKSVLKGNNIDEKALIASTTKILTALVALENMDIMRSLEIKKEDTLIEGSKVYLKEGEHIALIDVLYGLMLRSGNDCANLIARSYRGGYNDFIHLMNEKAKTIGMKNSNFMNPSGLDTLEENISTAYDMALLMAESIKNEYFLEIASTHSYSASTKEGSHYYWYNKDKSLTSDERFIAGKTGYTKKCGRTLVNYAKAYSREVIIVTINDGNDWQNHKSYLNSLNQYVTYTILSKGRYKIEDYIIEINNDIKIPILKDRKDEYYYILYLGKKTYLDIYLEKQFIIRYEVNLVFE